MPDNGHYCTKHLGGGTRFRNLTQCDKFATLPREGLKIPLQENHQGRRKGVCRKGETASRSGKHRHKRGGNGRTPRIRSGKNGTKKTRSKQARTEVVRQGGKRKRLRPTEMEGVEKN